ncbi:type IV pilus biogenesis/stability protein PilW [Thalassotalea piscium]
MKKILLALLCLNFVTGCVTQRYDGDASKPMVENESSNNEIAMTRISLGLGYLKMGNTTQAKLNLEKAKRFSPNLVQVHTAFAHYYDTVAEPELAIKSYEKALSIQSDDADTLNNYGAFLCKQEQYQAAEEQFLKAIAVPSYLLVSQSYQNLAICQLQAKHFTKAEMYLEKAILHSPSNASVLLQMVRLQYIKGDYKSAQSFFTRYERSSRHFTPGALALAFKIHEKQYDHKTAKNYASMLVKMFPASFEAKEYILNGLAVIEADTVATEYKLVMSPETKVKKRVVVLSPNKSLSQSMVQTAEKISSKASDESVTEPVLVNNEKNEAEQLVNDNQKETVSSTVNAITATDDEPENKLPVAKEASDIPVSTPETHVVAKGESLFSISQRYNVQMKAIERWNGISRNGILSLGQVLYVENPNKAEKSQEKQ